MIQRIPSWTWEPRGGGITMVAPSGTAVIRYRERIRPVQSVAAILRDRAADRRYRATATSAIEPLVTGEGEYGAAVDLVGEMVGSPAGTTPGALPRTLGFLFTDDWYSEVTGIALRPDEGATVAHWVRKLIVDSRLMLGTRRRRYVYAKPLGWDGYARLPLYMTWFPPEHPRDPTSITMYPALPAPSGIDEDPNFGMIPTGPPASAELIAETEPPAPVELGRLTGTRWQFQVRDERGRTMQRTTVLLRDDRYLYGSYLDRDAATAAPGDEGDTVYQALLASIEPLPAPHGAATGPGLVTDWF